MLKYLKGTGMIALAFILLLLSACQSKEEGSPQNGTAESSSQQSAEAASGGSPIEIQFWFTHGGKHTDTANQLIEKFNSSQNEVKVVGSFVGAGYADGLAKIQAAAVAKNLPDVVQIENVDTGSLARAGLLQDLSDLITPDKLKDFVPSMLGDSYVDGKLFSLPFKISTNILFMNATLLKENGLDPSGPKTWDELAAYARKLSIPGKRYGITTNLDEYRFEASVSAAGGTMLSGDGKKAAFDSASGLAALKFWTDLRRDGVMDSPVDAGEANKYALTKQSFLNGQTAMILNSTSDIAEITAGAEQAGFALQAAMFPKRDASVSFSSNAMGANISMIAGLSEDKKQAAWKFLNWLTEPEQAVLVTQNLGYIPVTASALNSQAMKALFEQNPVYQVAAEQMKVAAARPMEPAYKEIATDLRTEIERLMLDPKTDSASVIDQVAQKANKLLQKQ